MIEIIPITPHLNACVRDEDEVLVIAYRIQGSESIDHYYLVIIPDGSSHWVPKSDVHFHV